METITGSNKRAGLVPHLSLSLSPSPFYYLVLKASEVRLCMKGNIENIMENEVRWHPEARFCPCSWILLCSPRKDEYGNHVLLRGGKKRSRCNIPWPRGAAKYFSQEAPAIAHGFKNMSENAPNHSKPSENRLERRPPSSRLEPLEKTGVSSRELFLAATHPPPPLAGQRADIYGALAS